MSPRESAYLKKLYYLPSLKEAQHLGETEAYKHAHIQRKIPQLLCQQEFTT